MAAPMLQQHDELDPRSRPAAAHLQRSAKLPADPGSLEPGGCRRAHLRDLLVGPRRFKGYRPGDRGQIRVQPEHGGDTGAIPLGHRYAIGCLCRSKRVRRVQL